ncbi:MAG: exonuclease domain-containing protein [Erysipelotrichaceae bacterium]|nr:exonuclease domain-containing protein [Erysipelotrichaceae bacterium]MDD3810545.1 exonuclease domain-containing protein [Erysipelotrichaceae bacterium]
MVVVEYDEVVETYTTLLNPQAKLPPMITKITGITNEMLKDAPILDESIRTKVRELISGRVILGHNVTFDINFLRAHVCDIDNDHIDTLPLARACLPQLSHHRLTDLADYFDLEGDHHWAINDVLFTIAVYNRLSQHQNRR